MAVALVAVLCALIVGVVAWNHFKIGLFGQYNAGYGSVQAAPGASTAAQIAVCNVALRAAFPELAQPGRVGGMTWEMRAFDAGCGDRVLGRPSDPWTLHSQLASED